MREHWRMAAGRRSQKELRALGDVFEIGLPLKVLSKLGRSSHWALSKLKSTPCPFSSNVPRKVA